MNGAPSQMRLLWVNQFAVLPDDGGGTRHFEIARELVPLGWSTTIAASDLNLHSRRFTRRAGEKDHRAIREVVEDVEFVWLWTYSYRANNWRRGANWAGFAYSLLTSRQAARADVVIGSSPQLLAALAAERLAARWRVPFVLEVRDLWPESLLAAGGKQGAGYRGLEAIARYLYRKADRIVVLAKGAADYLEAAGVPRRKLAYVPNGVDAAAFEENKHPDSGPFTLLYAGAHGPANGLDAVLSAALLLKDRNDVRFLLVGDGPSKSELVARAAALQLENVEFRAPVPKKAIPELFASVHAGLMILRETPLFAFGVSPNKLFDYFAAGLPVVCNVPGEVATMVASAQAGEQARDATGEALADAVLRLASRTPAERRGMAAAARAWVAREHDRSILAGRLDQVLRNVVSE